MLVIIFIVIIFVSIIIIKTELIKKNNCNNYIYKYKYKKFDVVYTSWLSRAIETSWLVLNELGLFIYFFVYKYFLLISF
jgi:bisphosphoglycerate-dependent phosphoglycerate mutase